LLIDLELELERAEVVDPHEIPPDVITMNSTARLRDRETGESFEYTLVYPRDADADQQRVSVLAPVGTAIIGCRTGDVIEWPVPAGITRLEVEDVIYQPESAGRYDR
jgi:regulator of nucleoside diphosphate kinase